MEHGISTLDVGIWTLDFAIETLEVGIWTVDAGIGIGTQACGIWTVVIFTSGHLEVGIWTHGTWNLDTWRLESGPRDVGLKPLEVAIWTLQIEI